MGVPEVSLNGTPITFSRRRAFALLVYLAVTGHAHTRDVLGTLLSGEASESQARKRLSNALAELRQLVGDYVVTTRDTAAFNTSLPFWIDVRAFRQAVARGMEEGGLEPLEAALDLYHDEFLSGLTVSEASGFDEWVMLQGEALRTLAVQALQAIVTRSLRTKAHARGVTAARRLVTLEPLLEDAHRQLMTFLACIGQRQEALAQFETCRSILEDELGEEPSSETEALYHRLKLVQNPPPRGLPPRDSPCIGRESELGILTTRLADEECRLVTLIGLGGSGKTRLALEVAHLLTDASVPAEQPFPDGVFFLALDATPDLAQGDRTRLPDLIRRLAAVLGTTGTDGIASIIDTPEQLAAALRSKTLLLVLDGVDASPVKESTELVRLLLSCSRVTVLATSLEALQLPGEYVLPVGELELPAGAEDADRAPAGRLLLTEAQRFRLDFALNDEDRGHVARLCHLVGGMPLALKLLARCLPQLTPEDMVRSLETDLNLLSTEDPRIEDRHRAIGAILAEAWARLSSEEQRILRQLAVFHDGFDVMGAREVATCQVRDITRLMNAGMIAQCGHARYRLPVLIHRRAAQELAAHEEAAAAEERHAQYYARLAPLQRDDRRLPRLRGGDTREEAGNLKAAWRWAIARGRWDVLGRLCDGASDRTGASPVLDDHGNSVAQALVAVRTALTHVENQTPELETLMVNLLCQEAATLSTRARYRQAEQVLAEAAIHGQALEAPAVLARLAYEQGAARTYLGRYAEARGHLDRAVALAQAAGDRDLEADCLFMIGRLAHVLGASAEARELLQKVVAQYRDADNVSGEIVALIELGRIAIDQGEFEQGRFLLEHAQRLFVATDVDPMTESTLASTVGSLHLASGEHARAEQCFTRALEISRQIGWRETAAVNPILGECGALTSLGRLARLTEQLPRAHQYLSEALDLGHAIGSEQAAAVALGEMSLLAHAEGDDDRARQLAKHGLSLTGRAEPDALHRPALMALGHAEWGLGHLQEAAAAYAQALKLDRECGNRRHLVESTADLARVSLAEGDRLHAAALVDSILDDVLLGAAVHVEEPTRAYLSVYEVLHAIGDDREAVVLEARQHILQDRGASIPGEMQPLVLSREMRNTRDHARAQNGNGFHHEAITHAGVHRNP
jgi:DNA-binding SARP family transcriptional activator/predicted ATPase